MYVDWLDRQDLEDINKLLESLIKKYVKINEDTEKDLGGDWIIEQLHGDIISSIVELLNYLKEKKEALK